MKLELGYEINFGYVQKLQITHLIPLKTILSAITNFPSPSQARSVFRPNQYLCILAKFYMGIQCNISVVKNADIAANHNCQTWP